MAVLGPNGKPISGFKKRPITDEIAVVTVRDRWSSYPSEGLTPGKLARIFKEADAGDVYRQMELFEEMEEKDCHLFAEMQKRKQAVLSLDYEVIPYSKSRADKKAAQLVQDALEFEGFEEAMLDTLDAIGKGFSVCEIMWAVRDGQAKVDRLKWVHPKRFIFGDLPQGDPDEIRLLTAEEPVRGIELPPDKFVVHKYKARSGHPSRAGVIRVCAWMYLFKNYNIKDWVTFAEVYGMPLRLGKYDANTSPEDKQKLIEAVVQLGTDAAGIISKSTEIEFVQAMKNADNNVFETLANFCNREMSKAILGQTLTAEVGDKGSYAASQTHNEVRKDLLKADAKALAETLRKDIFRPLVRFNMGEEANLPWLKYDLSEPEDQEKTARVYSILIGECGLPVSSKHVYEKFAIPEPEEGEEMLSPPTAPGVGFKALKEGAPSLPANPQREIDSLADKGRELAGSAIETLLEPLRALIVSGASLEEIRDKLPDIYGEMDSSELEELIARAMFAADLYGRWAADED